MRECKGGYGGRWRSLETVGAVDPCAFDGSLLDSLSAKEMGAMGEELAASYLEEAGYTIVERNYRCPEGEADLIAFDPDEDAVVLVEVKTRRVRHADDLYPEEAVDSRKERRYRRIACCYAAEHCPVPAIRFDVIGVTVAAGYIAGVDHVSGAFDWDVPR